MFTRQTMRGLKYLAKSVSLSPSLSSVQGARPAAVALRSFTSTKVVSMGFDEFYEKKDAQTEGDVITGRAWTATDLRRKSFDDLHKLWFVLYKERNMLLTDKEKKRRNLQPITNFEEERYAKVKRSMGAIKFVLRERSKMRKTFEEQSAAEGKASDLADTKTRQDGKLY